MTSRHLRTDIHERFQRAHNPPAIPREISDFSTKLLSSDSESRMCRVLQCARAGVQHQRRALRAAFRVRHVDLVEGAPAHSAPQLAVFFRAATEHEPDMSWKVCVECRRVGFVLH